MKTIEEKIITAKPIIPVKEKGIIKEIQILDEYLAFQMQFLKDISSLKIALDCSNGMAGILIKQLLGNQASYLNDQPDGTFPGHAPNPLVAKNIVQLQSAVAQHHCDVGVIFDGDADRVMFVDEQGEFISPDLMIGLLGHYFLEQKNKPELFYRTFAPQKPWVNICKKWAEPCIPGVLEEPMLHLNFVKLTAFLEVSLRAIIIFGIFIIPIRELWQPLLFWDC